MMLDCWVDNHNVSNLTPRENNLLPSQLYHGLGQHNIMDPRSEQRGT